MEWVFCCCCCFLSCFRPQSLLVFTIKVPGLAAAEHRNTVLSVIFLLGLLDPLNLEALGLQTGWRCFLPHETSSWKRCTKASPSGLFFCISRRRLCYCCFYLLCTQHREVWVVVTHGKSWRLMIWNPGNQSMSSRPKTTGEEYTNKRGGIKLL